MRSTDSSAIAFNASRQSARYIFDKEFSNDFNFIPVLTEKRQSLTAFFKFWFLNII